MKTMRAAVQQGIGELVVEARAVPEVGEHEVLIEVAYCGICGSDLHFVLDGWSPPGAIHGHEYSGVIAALGEEVRGWKVGDHVVGGPEARCGRCAACRAGRPSLCDDRDTPGKTPYQGAFAHFKLLPAAQLVPVPGGLGLREAALTEPLAIALHAVNRSRFETGQSVLITGAGPIGALVLALVRETASSVTVVEPSPARRRLATALGANRVLLPDELVVPSIAEPELQVDGAVDVAFECSGRRVAMEAALAQLGRGGTLVLVGAGIDPPRFDPNRILLNELLVTGAFNYDDQGFEHALSLLSGGQFPTGLLIEPTDTALDTILDTMHGLAAGEIPGKAMVRPMAGDNDGGRP